MSYCRKAQLQLFDKYRKIKTDYLQLDASGEFNEMFYKKFQYLKYV